MEKDDKGSTMIRMGVSGWMFLLVPAYPGCQGSKAVKRSLLYLEAGQWRTLKDPRHLFHLSRVIAHSSLACLSHARREMEILRTFSNPRTIPILHHCRNLEISVQVPKLTSLHVSRSSVSLLQTAMQLMPLVDADGAAIICMLKPTGFMTFKQYAQSVFPPYLNSLLKDILRLDVVWGVYTN